MLRLIALPILAILATSPEGGNAVTASAQETITPTCNAGAIQQGGLLLCTGEPGTTVYMNGGAVAVFDADGRASVGLAQHAETDVTLRFTSNGERFTESLTLATRDDDFRVLEGMDCDRVDARTQEQIDHAGRSWVKKQAAFQEFNEGAGIWNGVTRPSEGPMSSPFGPTRRYTGVSAVTGEACDSVSVHRGYDIATPVGTPVVAPADGVITLADGDLYYEGGAIFLDHGQGLVSVFMHLSDVQVEAGQRVTAGEQIALTGNTGRTTGPHLHWSVKWRNTASDDRGGDFYIDPALLLEIGY